MKNQRVGKVVRQDSICVLISALKAGEHPPCHFYLSKSLKNLFMASPAAAPKERRMPQGIPSQPPV
jgi:hypothetical protein